VPVEGQEEQTYRPDEKRLAFITPSNHDKGQHSRGNSTHVSIRRPSLMGACRYACKASQTDAESLSKMATARAHLMATKLAGLLLTSSYKFTASVRVLVRTFEP
jgi:hypothetical protein